ncbi:MAG: DUF3187 family protein [Deltaproteobacteria bacterium]|nr:DUF3187 family protein [Deltaproteobacteria bacterium]
MLIFILFPSLLKAYWRNGFGPLNTRNQFPLNLIFLDLNPEPAITLPVKRLKVELISDYSNIFLMGYHQNLISETDMEMLRTSLILKGSPFNNMEFGIEIPVYGIFGGFLDHFIEEFHNTFGFESATRENFPQNYMQYKFVYNNSTFIDLHSDSGGLGDIVLSSKYIVKKEKRWTPALSLRGAIKFPTGNRSYGFSSGKFDFGLGVAMQKSISSFVIYGNLNGIYPRNPGYHLHLDPFLSMNLALEYLLKKNFSLVVQVSGATSPFNVGDKSIDGFRSQIIVGLFWEIKENVIIQLAFTEDLTHNSIPDFTFSSGVRFVF